MAVGERDAGDVSSFRASPIRERLGWQSLAENQKLD
jgi:hypothetical protein